jgi:cytochrome P450
MTEPALAGIDLTDLGNFANGFPHHLFEIHRREAPVWWHEPTEHTPDGEGFWSVATYAETLEVLSDATTYSSERGGHREHGGTFIQDLPIAGIALNMMDDPRERSSWEDTASSPATRSCSGRARPIGTSAGSGGR